MVLGRLIRESRLKKGLSLGQLASAVGRSSSSVRRWERGEVAPALGILSELARVLDLDESDLRRLRPIPPTESTSASTPHLGPDPGSTPQQAAAVAEDVAGEVATTAFPKALVVGETSRPGGLLRDLWNTAVRRRDSWIGWVRGVMTAVALIAMAVVFVWALRELLAALGDVLDSFGTGA